jgi:hypothetical protein
MRVFGDPVIRIGPFIDDLVVPLIVGDQSHVVVVPSPPLPLPRASSRTPLFDGRRDQVTQVEGQSSFEGPQEAHGSLMLSRNLAAVTAKLVRSDDITDDLFQVLLGEQFVHMKGTDTSGTDTH